MCVRQLLRYGANANLPDSSWRRPSEIAKESGFLNLAKDLQAYQDILYDSRIQSSSLQGNPSIINPNPLKSTESILEHLPFPFTSQSCTSYPLNMDQKNNLSNALFENNNTKPFNTSATNATSNISHPMKTVFSVPSYSDITTKALIDWSYGNKVRQEAFSDAGNARARLCDWLASLSILYALPAFIATGYDDVDFIAAEGLREEDLDILGISAPGHRRKLLALHGITRYTNIAKSKDNNEITYNGQGITSTSTSNALHSQALSIQPSEPAMQANPVAEQSSNIEFPVETEIINENHGEFQEEW
jgi:SAM domain (Sterile alpha motif)